LDCHHGLTDFFPIPFLKTVPVLLGAGITVHTGGRPLCRTFGIKGLNHFTRLTVVDHENHGCSLVGLDVAEVEGALTGFVNPNSTFETKCLGLSNSLFNSGVGALVHAKVYHMDSIRGLHYLFRLSCMTTVYTEMDLLSNYDIKNTGAPVSSPFSAISISCCSVYISRLPSSAFRLAVSSNNNQSSTIRWLPHAKP